MNGPNDAAKLKLDSAMKLPFLYNQLGEVVNILYHNFLTPTLSIRNVNHGIVLSVICECSE